MAEQVNQERVELALDEMSPVEVKVELHLGLCSLQDVAVVACAQEELASQGYGELDETQDWRNLLFSVTTKR